MFIEKSDMEYMRTFPDDGANKETYSIDDTKSICVRFYLVGENENNAKRLSQIDCQIRENCHPIILQNGSSEYFNKKMYPLFNEFECRLRKLLYISSTINPNVNTEENLRNLEDKDFGELFEILFIDIEFYNTVKKKINNTSKEYFSKKNLINLLSELDEKPLWDALLGKDAVPTLRENYDLVRLYRNDVMHSHYVDWNKYKAMQDMMLRVNSELSLLLKTVEGPEFEQRIPSNYNDMIMGALYLSEIMKHFSEQVQPTIEPISNTLKELFENPEYLKVKAGLESLSSNYNDSELSKVMKKLSNITKNDEDKEKD